MSNNEFDDIISKEIIPVIRKVVNSSHGMKNIKLAHALHSIRIGIIRTCDLYQDLDKYITPNEFSRIFIEIQKPDHGYSNFLEESR